MQIAIKQNCSNPFPHNIAVYYSDAIMSAMASQVNGVSIVYSTVCSGADQRKHQSSVPLAFVRGIHRLIMFPLDEIIITYDKNAAEYFNILGFMATDCCRPNPRLHKDTRKQEWFRTMAKNFYTDTMLCIKPTIAYYYDLTETVCSDIMNTERNRSRSSTRNITIFYIKYIILRVITQTIKVIYISACSVQDA